jgi:hypothetical protein
MRPVIHVDDDTPLARGRLAGAVNAPGRGDGTSFNLKGAAMTHVWVYKFDGTIQCDDVAKETPLEEMRKQLETLVGSGNVLSMKKGLRPMIQLCGMPTGTVNCYELTEAGWALLSSGIAGCAGFQRLDHGPQEAEGEVNLGRLIGSLTAFNPQSVQDLVGHPLRVYSTGDALTKDWRPDRCNVEVDGARTIVKIWFG